MSPENSISGLDGGVLDCNYHNNANERASCQSRTDTVYGEHNLVQSATLGTKRRDTFNSDFGTMMDNRQSLLHHRLVSTNCLLHNDSPIAP